MKKYPVLILHGWNLNAFKYRYLISELKKSGLKIVCFDLPGFRNTPPIFHPWTIADYGNYVMDYLKNRHIEKVIIVGHSFGGRIGIYLSVNFPNMVKALVLSGTPGLGADLTLKEKAYLILAKSGKIIFSLPLLSLLREKLRKILYRIIGSYDYYKTDGVLRETFKNIVAYRLEQYLSEIKQPVLVIWGEKDKIVPVKVAYGMNKIIKNSKINIVSNAGHGVLFTHPKEFAGLVEKFIDIL